MKQLEVIPENGYYTHYKHDPAGEAHNYTYEVVGIARNTEEKTYSVLYRPLYATDWFAPAAFQARPLDMFVENVQINGIEVPRFSKVADPRKIAELNTVRDEMYGA